MLAWCSDSRVCMTYVFICLLSFHCNCSSAFVDHMLIFMQVLVCLCLPVRCTLLFLASNVGRQSSSRPTLWLSFMPGTRCSDCSFWVFMWSCACMPSLCFQYFICHLYACLFCCLLACVGRQPIWRLTLDAMPSGVQCPACFNCWPLLAYSSESASVLLSCLLCMSCTYSAAFLHLHCRKVYHFSKLSYPII